VVAAVGICHGALVARGAERLGVDVTAPVSPEVPAAAFRAQGDGAAVAEDHGLPLVADPAQRRAVGDDHGNVFPRPSKFCANVADAGQKGKPAAPGADPAGSRDDTVKRPDSVRFKTPRRRMPDKGGTS